MEEVSGPQPGLWHRRKLRLRLKGRSAGGVGGLRGQAARRVPLLTLGAGEAWSRCGWMDTLQGDKRGLGVPCAVLKE